MKIFFSSSFFTLLVASGLIIFSACSNNASKADSDQAAEEPEPASEQAEASEPATPGDLKTWTLTAYGTPENLSSVPEEVTITMQMDVAQNKVSGSAGCNNYFGQLSDQDDGYRITGVGSTKKMCPEGVVMEMEDKYLRMLNQVTGYAFRDNKMIVDVDGDMQLIFSGAQ